MTMLVRGGAVTGSALPATATTGQVLQWNGSAWVAATPSASGTTPNATPTVPGLVQLAGDLGGTATAPTVPALTGKADKTALAAVATSGAYTDLTGRPALATVATSGAYTDLTGRPALATVATSGSYGDLTGRPLLATVATTGAYADLTGTPTVPTQYLRVKTAASSTTVASYTTDPHLQVASLPVGTYILEAYLFATATNATSTIWTFTSGAGIAGSWNGLNSTTPAATSSLAVNKIAASGQGTTLTGVVSITTAQLFGVQFQASTAGSTSGFDAGSWLRLTKLA